MATLPRDSLSNGHLNYAMATPPRDSVRYGHVNYVFFLQWPPQIYNLYAMDTAVDESLCDGHPTNSFKFRFLFH